MKPALYLDLDRTLFQTDLAGPALWREIAAMYPAIDAGVELRRISQFHVYDDRGLYYYDFSMHLSVVGLNSETVYAMLRASPLGDGRFEYSDVADFIDWAKVSTDVSILTYGADDYQRLKISLCPSLRDMQVITLIGDKTDWLKDRGVCSLVDDRPPRIVELPHVFYVQASLEGTLIARGQWPVARSLVQAKEYLQHNIDK